MLMELILTDGLERITAQRRQDDHGLDPRSGFTPVTHEGVTERIIRFTRGPHILSIRPIPATPTVRVFEVTI